jgi:hypothetical protein
MPQLFSSVFLKPLRISLKTLWKYLWIIGHKISEKGIEIDNSEIIPLEQLPRPQDVKGLQNFLSHARFYKRFIKDFASIAAPLTNLLQKDVPFTFDNEYNTSFEQLKKALVTAPIIQPPNWWGGGLLK